MSNEPSQFWTCASKLNFLLIFNLSMKGSGIAAVSFFCLAFFSVGKKDKADSPKVDHQEFFDDCAKFLTSIDDVGF